MADCGVACPLSSGAMGGLRLQVSRLKSTNKGHHSFPTMPLSYGLNITKKPAVSSSHPPPAKRKTIFDDDNELGDGPDDEDNAESIDTIGGLTSSSIPPPPSRKQRPEIAANKPFRQTSTSQHGNLSSNRTALKYAKEAQTLDPSIYDYDSFYDTLHAKPATTSNQADQEKRPKYMNSLMAAAEVRKRDQLRAKEKLLAREREAEGDEFAGKEKFVTAAYRRQQEENRRLDEEEAAREKEDEERQRREGTGMKGLYKDLLKKNEQNHAMTIKAVEEAKARGPEALTKEAPKEKKGEKSEVDLAKEKGAVINEDGQVVDKLLLLDAGINASSKPRPSAHATKEASSNSNSTRTPRPPVTAGGRGGGRKESARERETRLFEEQLLGKRAYDDDDDDDDNNNTTSRAAKSQRLEDEILGLRR